MNIFMHFQTYVQVFITLLIYDVVNDVGQISDVRGEIKNHHGFSLKYISGKKMLFKITVPYILLFGFYGRVLNYYICS